MATLPSASSIVAVPIGMDLSNDASLAASSSSSVGATTSSTSTLVTSVVTPSSIPSSSSLSSSTPTPTPTLVTPSPPLASYPGLSNLAAATSQSIMGGSSSMLVYEALLPSSKYDMPSEAVRTAWKAEMPAKRNTANNRKQVYSNKSFHMTTNA
jgi:hypothetical protein